MSDLDLRGSDVAIDDNDDDDDDDDALEGATGWEDKMEKEFGVEKDGGIELETILAQGATGAE